MGRKIRRERRTKIICTIGPKGVEKQLHRHPGSEIAQDFHGDLTVLNRIADEDGPLEEIEQLISALKAPLKLFLTELALAGCDAIRLNLSHSRGFARRKVEAAAHEQPHMRRLYAWEEALLDALEEVNREEGWFLPAIVDMQGPKVRTAGHAMKVKPGMTVEIHSADSGALPEPHVLRIDDPDYLDAFLKLPSDERRERLIFIGDGETVLRKIGPLEDGTGISAEVLIGHEIQPRKGFTIQGFPMASEALTEKDRFDLLGFFIPNYLKSRAHMLAVSFVSDAHDLEEVRRLVALTADDPAAYDLQREYEGFEDYLGHELFADPAGHEAEIRAKGRQLLGPELPLISKIETPDAVKNIEEIIEASYGVMVARGDLGLMIPPQDVPAQQKRIIDRCNLRSKPVIVATQMLDSMEKMPIPKRPETTDVFNAVCDDADCLMLSGETAAGEHPLLAVRTMREIIQSAEGMVDRGESSDRRGTLREAELDAPDSVALRAVQLAESTGAAAILCETHFGATPRRIARFLPGPPVLAAVQLGQAAYRLGICRDVFPVGMQTLLSAREGDLSLEHEEDFLRLGVRIASEHLRIEDGELIYGPWSVPLARPEVGPLVISGGWPLRSVGTTNLILLLEMGRTADSPD